MTDSQLTQLEQLARAATPGPWRFEPSSGMSFKTYEPPLVIGADDKRIAAVDGGSLSARADTDTAQFIAAASPDVVLALVQELRAARGDGEKLAAIAAAFNHWANGGMMDACEDSGATEAMNAIGAALGKPF